MTNQSWYGVHTTFRSERMEDGKLRRVFEERILLFRAASFEEALAKGDAEAKRYASESQGCTPLDHIVAFHIHDEELREGDEVWSCMREADVSDQEFLRRIYEDECASLTNVPLERRNA